ncbi:MAG: chorismate mutase [Ignavibacteria bacterium]|nr:chorismate mutase [Ignavibacteria bacterium]MDH7528110.1 chorismate mutase [Ignavibacteria bacterium]
MQEQIQNTENKLDELRKRIDLVDQQILLLLSARNDFVKKVAQLKKENGIPVYDESREKQLINDWIESSKILGLSEEFVKSILELIISESRRIQKEIIE